MNFTVVSKGIRSHSAPFSQRESARDFDFPGIPHSLSRRKLNRVDKEFQAKKKKFLSRLPILNEEQIQKYRNPFHILLVGDLNSSGHEKVAREISFILEQEKLQAEKHLISERNRLTKQHELLRKVADSLTSISDLIGRNEIMSAILARKNLAEFLMEQDEKFWLVKIIYFGCIEIAKKFKDKDLKAKIECEIKCIVAHLEINQQDLNDESLQRTIKFLEDVRAISRGRLWILQTKVMVVKLKRPVSFLKIREAFDEVNCHGLTTFNVATLLRLEILVSRASQIAFLELDSNGSSGDDCNDEKSVQDQNLDMALENAQHALQLSMEIHKWTSISTCYLILGTLHLKTGNYEKAHEYFQNLLRDSDFHEDDETKAVALNFLGKFYTLTENAEAALEMFSQQREISEGLNNCDLEASALQEIGSTLLKEGVIIEAELCFAESWYKFQLWQNQIADQNKQNKNNQKRLNCEIWAMSAIASALNLWTRFSGHIRRGHPSDLDQIHKWKTNRHPLDLIPHPTNEIPVVTNFFNEFEPDTKIPLRKPKSIVEMIMFANLNLLPHHMIHLPTDAKSLQAIDELVKEEQREKAQKQNLKDLEHEPSKRNLTAHFHTHEQNDRKESQKKHKVLFENLENQLEVIPPSAAMRIKHIAKFDEGPEIRYESDGFSADDNYRNSGDNLEDRINEIRSLRNKSKLYALRQSKLSLGHGGVSGVELRPSISLHVTSFSRTNSQHFEDRKTAPDVRLVVSTPVVPSRRQTAPDISTQAIQGSVQVHKNRGHSKGQNVTSQPHHDSTDSGGRSAAHSKSTRSSRAS